MSEIPLLPTERLGTRRTPGITSPKDPGEREADRLADGAIRMPAADGGGTDPLEAARTALPREVRERKHPPSWTKSQPWGVLTYPVARFAANALGTGGRALDGDTRAEMERRFGFDFGQVRIHTDARAASAANALSARAFTIGRHIAFANGEHAPATAAGRRLLAHELAHVLQQGRRSGGRSQLAIVARVRADRPYQDTVTFDRIDRRGGIHWAIRVHIPSELDGSPLDLPTAIACIQAALRRDVQRRRVSELVGTSESLRSAVEESLARQRSQDTIDIVVRYTRQPVRGNRVASLEIEPSGPVPVEEEPGEVEEPAQTPVLSCPSWTPVDDAYVEERILELLVEHNGDTRSAWHAIRDERNRSENCCNLNHTAIEHYFDFRAQVGDGEQSAGYSQLESASGAVARAVLTPYARITGSGRTGNCPPSPPSAAVIGWEQLGILDGERDFELTPPERGARSSISSAEFLRIRILNTRSDRRERIEEVHREIERSRPGSIVSTPR